ncbi:SIR2 family protein [Dyadobacter psychrotolerans]|uniref:Uncharacterized protein n=1 Tax=Dyadobacter psychrotolerans TaxID=2541721 RepID=A0A4R5DR64_9BACT|nr:SIR2 family protein [Dyadobacter psychrotolerans]TDE14774.1 hypothetical protein E0F88_16440 [Dyadobacter psychrotolerans]
MINNQITTASYSVFTNKGAFALLLGSGISSAAGIPTGWAIALKLIEQIARNNNESPLPTADQWYRNYFGAEPDYSDILAKLTISPEERLNLLRPFIEPTRGEFENGEKRPTKAHRQIAQLVAQGYIRVIITTNFDRLIETALIDLGVAPSVISNPNQIDNVIPLIHSKVTIFKINGDYLDTKFLNVKEELTAYDPRLAEQLRFIFENFGLVTCGWSATWDLALLDILKSANKFRYSNYFTHLYTADPGLQDIAGTRQGQLIQIRDADSFFSDLYENVEALERNDTMHPATPAIVLSKIKKFIVKEEHLISLSDLLHDITEDCYSRIHRIKPGKINDVVAQYQLDMDLILTAMTNSAFWSKAYQYPIILNIIRRIFAGNASSQLSAETSRVPALLLRYACGISCLASNNFNLLKELCNLRVKYHQNNFYSLTDVTNQWWVLNSESLKKAYGNNYKMPQSMLISEILRPYFQNLIPGDEDYKYQFQIYELLISLKHHQNDSNSTIGFPQGSYSYDREESAYKYVSDQLLLGDESQLIMSGLFSSISDLNNLFGSYKEKISGRYDPN